MKNLKYLFLASLGLMSAPMLAQETYQDTKFAENSLTGTARYVGMGGAMEALGADISTIPATLPVWACSERAWQVSRLALWLSLELIRNSISIKLHLASTERNRFLVSTRLVSFGLLQMAIRM